jgi:hypothetical protein
MNLSIVTDEKMGLFKGFVPASPRSNDECFGFKRFRRSALPASRVMKHRPGSTSLPAMIFSSGANSALSSRGSMQDGL